MFMRMDIQPPADLVFGASCDHGDLRDASPYGASPTFVGTAGISGTYGIGDGDRDYASLGDASYFTFSDGATDRPFSFFIWVYRTTTLADIIHVISAKENYALSRYEWLFGLFSPSNKLAVYLYSGSSGSKYISCQSSAAQVTVLNQWYSVGFSYDGSGTSAGLRLYVNGVPVAVVPASAGVYVAMSDTAGLFTVGGRVDAVANRCWPGRFDTPQLYSRELSAVEFANLHQLGRR